MPTTFPKVYNRFDKSYKRKSVLDYKLKKKDGVLVNPKLTPRTIQSERDNVNINTIVAKARKQAAAGSLAVSFGPTKRPVYGDFSSALDFQDAQNKVIKVRQHFETLPSEIRNKFQNDAAQYVEFMLDEKNKEEAIKLGLLPKPVFKTVKEETPDGDFWVTTKDGVEIDRKAVKKAPEPTKAPSA